MDRSRARGTKGVVGHAVRRLAFGPVSVEPGTLPFAAAAGAGAPPAATSLKGGPTFLTWNLRHGGGAARMPEITLALLGHAPDVVVLSEFRWTTGGQIAGVLADHGLRHHAGGESAGAAGGGNSVFIASRAPIEPDGGAPAARRVGVRVPEWGVSLIGVHAPCSGRETDRKRTVFFRNLIDDARGRAHEAVLILGDFNLGRHRQDEDGATFRGTRFLGDLATCGYEDAWRARHTQTRDFSWFSHTGRGFRIDHALASRSLAARVRACEYDHSLRESGLSDHSALVVRLDAPGA